MTHAVSDAGPLIHLHEIGALDTLAVFSTVHVPTAVWHEAVDRHAVPGQRLEDVVRVERHEVDAAAQSFAVAEALGHLQRGDIESLYLGVALRRAVLLTDDLAVRREAARRDIQPVGSLGVVVRAFVENRLALHEAEARIEALYTVSSLFVTRAVVDLALARLRERRP